MMNTNQHCDIAIVGGVGHVGIPLTLCFAAAGMKVLIHDRNREAMDNILRGKLPFIEHDAQPLLDKALEMDRIFCSDNPEDIRYAKSVIITIGTPVDEFLNPVNKVVKACLDGLLPHLVDGQLIVLRSTVYPRTTDWLHAYLVGSGKKLLVGFCPERIIQGYGIAELRSMPQIISGTTVDAEEAAVRLFEHIAPDIVRVKPIEAEFAKLFSNAYRYIDFATTNQFYMIAQSAGADYTRILEAMKRNYPRAERIPSPGFTAGPCLLKDTMQLAAFSRNQFALGHAAMLVNEGLVLFVMDRLRAEWNLTDTTVGILGMAFKPEVDDIRSSLSYKLKKMLFMEAKSVLTTDPFVMTDPKILPVEDVINQSNVLILCTPHKAYKSLDIKGKPVIDIWNFLDA